jgi:hypothetical protein
MSGDHNQHQKDKSYLDGMDRYKQVRELVKDPSLRIKDIVELTGYDKGHVSRLRKASQQFECPRCGHCCLSLVDAYDTSQKRVDEMVKTEHDKQIEIAQAYERGWNAALAQQEPVAWITDGGKGELWWYQSSKFDEEGNLIGPNPDDIPLYTTSPKREWVGLTDEEIWSNGSRLSLSERGIREFARAIEAKLKEKNGG